jgi:hypothetical protein
LPRIALWDAPSESFWEGNKKQHAPACYGFHACPGLPSGMHEVNPFGKETKKQQAPACYGFHACPGLPSGMHEVNPFGKETKNNKRQLVMVSMLAQDCPLGCTNAAE